MKKIIDVSEHNGKINWEETKKHIDGAILRCGYGMDMDSQDDKYWKYNADECTRLGIPFGVYLYSYATTDVKSKSEASHVLRLIKGYNLSYPVYLDLEEESAPDTRKHAVRGAKIFAEIIEKAGYTVGIYANENWFKTIIKGQLNTYTKWVAKYSSTKPSIENVDMWQYSSKGCVPGIKNGNGNVDMNFCYRDFVGKTEGSGYMFEPKVVKVGSKSTSVLLLQEILKARGFYKGKLDQDFGRQTIDAVNAYQEYRAKQGKKLTESGKGNGICGKDMWKDLIAI